MEIKITSRAFYSLIFLGVILTFCISVWAYGSSSPEVMGHSGEEINVEVNGEIKSLNQALNDMNYAASKELYFGGMWGEPSTSYINPLTGGKSCPAGYIDKIILGYPNIDYNVHLCVGIPGEVEKVAEFGGMWGDPSAGYTNPLADDKKACPEGYNDQLILGYPNIDYGLHFCYSKDLTNPVIKYFGGVYGGPSYINPATLVYSCPLGYNEKVVLGHPNIDYNINFCYK